MMTIALAGNQNAGKSALFNYLTGGRAKVGNWPGVTVEKVSGVLRRELLPQAFKGERVLIIDLPGVYSLTPYTPEEAVTRDFILKAKPDALLNVADSTNLARNLYLTTQLLSLGRPLVVALNMTDRLRKAGGAVDADRLGKALGTPCVCVSAKDGEGVSELVNSVLEAAKCQNIPKPLLPWSPDAGAITAYAQLAKRRYDWIDSALADALAWRDAGDKAATAGASGAFSRFIDRALACRPAAFGILALAMLSVFALSFGTVGGAAARALSAAMDAGIARVDALLLAANTPPMTRGLIADGALRGVAAVAGLLPPMMLFFFLLSLLEDTGLMARSACLFDPLLRRAGLTGRSLMPLLTGFGCTVPAVMACRALSTRRERMATALLVPYIPCGAKAPVYLCVTAAFFPGKPFALAFLYALGVLAAALGAVVMGNIGKSPPATFLMETPPLRLPSLRGAGRVMKDKARDFLSRAFTVVFACAVVVWALGAFTPRLQPADMPERSLLYLLGGGMARVFAPLGFGTAQAAVSLVAGVFAKENIVAALGMAGGAGQVLGGSAAALSYLTFAALYAPCCASCAVLGREAGHLRTALAVIIQTAFAWGVAFLVYRAALILTGTR